MAVSLNCCGQACGYGRREGKGGRAKATATSLSSASVRALTTHAFCFTHTRTQTTPNTQTQRSLASKILLAATQERGCCLHGARQGCRLGLSYFFSTPQPPSSCSWHPRSTTHARRTRRQTQALFPLALSLRCLGVEPAGNRSEGRFVFSACPTHRHHHALSILLCLALDQPQ